METLGFLIGGFEDGVLHHGDLAKTLKAMYIARAEMKSDDRDEYITGQSTGWNVHNSEEIIW